MTILFASHNLRARYTLRQYRLRGFFSIVTIMLMLASSLTTAPAHAAQSYDSCTGFIDALPAVISTSGTWCLRSDLSTAQTNNSAITIATNNVTIDCNDFLINGAGSLVNITFGISALNQLNATVRNCTIRGFYEGIRFTINNGSINGGHLVEDNRLDLNASAGIDVKGDGTMVRRNLITNTGASTRNFGVGILTTGSVDVIDNTINKVTALSTSDAAHGIFIESNLNGQIAGNRIRNVINLGSGPTVLITVVTSSRLSLRDNDLVAVFALGSTGIGCSGNTSSRPFLNLATGNILKGFQIANAMHNCVNSPDGIGNVILP